MADTQLAEAVASAAAEYGTWEIANWLPPDKHEWLRETIFDIVFSAIVAAYGELPPRQAAEPSNN